MKDPIETAKQLVRTVVRMFYEIEHVVVMDALCYHGALPISDLVLVLEAGKNSKHVGKIVGKLKEAGMCAVYSQQVMREGATKQTSREYYYIDYRRAIDACKYKIHKIDETVKKNAKPTAEKAELKCTRCKSQFTTMDVLNSIDPEPTAESSGFLCLRCGHPLDEIDAGGQADDMADDTPAKFNKLFSPLLTLMAEIDQMKIPAVEGKDAVEAKIELPRDKNIDPGTRHEVVETVVARPTAVRGLDTGPEKISIQIGSSAEQNEKQRAAEKARQEKIQMQNQLPSWHTESTVVKNANGTTTTVKQELDGTMSSGIKTEASESKSANQNLDAVFAQIEAERRRKEQEDDDDDDDDEDDDDEFEDVAVGTPSAAPEAKRVKLESSAAPTPSNAATPAASNGEGGDESEEDEFEDVN
jgi:transcription initiation factor TFIIE subunit alpha